MVELRREVDVPWMPRPNEVVLATCEGLPPPEAVTAAFVLAFDRRRLLLADLVRRGPEPPGGHVEPGESPERAARREAWEEACARLSDLRPLAFQRHRLLGPRPERHPYPYPDSYMVFFVGRVAALEPMVLTPETAGRRLLAPDEARAQPWVRRCRPLYEAALAADVARGPGGGAETPSHAP